MDRASDQNFEEQEPEVQSNRRFKNNKRVSSKQEVAASYDTIQEAFQAKYKPSRDVPVRNPS